MHKRWLLGGNAQSLRANPYKLDTFEREKAGQIWSQVNVTLDSSLIEDNRVDLYQLAKTFAAAILSGEVTVKHDGEEVPEVTDINEGDIPF